MFLARHAFDENNLSRCRELLQKHVPRDGATDLRDFEWFYLLRQLAASDWTVPAVGGWVIGISVSEDQFLLGDQIKD
jgi:hypothetical protein